MLALFLRILFVVVLLRIALEVARGLGLLGPRRRRSVEAGQATARRKRPKLEGEIVDAEFEDLDKGKRS